MNRFNDFIKTEERAEIRSLTKTPNKIHYGGSAETVDIILNEDGTVDMKRTEYTDGKPSVSWTFGVMTKEEFIESRNAIIEISTTSARLRERALKVLGTQLYAEVPDIPSPEEYEWTDPRVICTLSGITEQQYRRFRLYSKGFTEEEIAEREGCTQKAVSQSITVAREKLREAARNAEALYKWMTRPIELCRKCSYSKEFDGVYFCTKRNKAIGEAVVFSDARFEKGRLVEPTCFKERENNG